jgi:hypothetical protein
VRRSISPAPYSIAALKKLSLPDGARVLTNREIRKIELNACQV